MQAYVLGHLASTSSFPVLFKVVPETPRNALKYLQVYSNYNLTLSEKLTKDAP
jgi:hypothetical protein